ncbi:LytR/AlgR family response regulator transcription factor [Piscinibacter koreensis]|uniref:Response regulator transcription factor n=1 Tax=Piscinibacter koreensis TaxID=2742824 RepID=A0A7Y6NLV7_9BURK|nr:LytTR family DNA-binding domain-containing protein [Schlegelella koreensis]NUZ05608.1 response regulator transcription factor [Schlegelella koreensis]
MNEPRPTALIAEDEPLLAQALAAELARAWPALDVVAIVGDGASAVREALARQPDVLFFDIRMPGMDGLDAAAALADAWDAARPFPALVFVTAYDAYAVQAFDAHAVDYVLKPVQPARLARTVARLQETLARQRDGGGSLEAALDQLRALLPGAAGSTEPSLQWVTVAEPGAAATASLRMVSIDDVIAFEAADKYVRVLTTDAEHWIRTPLKELIGRLDANRFWQVHRGAVVRASAIERVLRDESGRVRLQLRGRPDRIEVSRLHAQRFKAM